MDAVEYFRWMSSLAGRISADIDLTKCAYQDLWHGLTQAERDQVINEAIIDPAVVLKYNSQSQSNGKIKANSKFSWFTKSQLDLFGESMKEIGKSEPVRKKGPAPEPPIRRDSNPNGQNAAAEQNLIPTSQNVPTAPTQPLRVIVPSPVHVSTKKRALIASPPSEPNNLFGRLKNRQRSEDRQPLVPTESCVSVIRTKPSENALHPSAHPPARLAKPKTPPPPPPTATVMTESLSLLFHDEVDSIPKTGFDFLDNW